MKFSGIVKTLRKYSSPYKVLRSTTEQVVDDNGIVRPANRGVEILKLHWQPAQQGKHFKALPEGKRVDEVKVFYSEKRLHPDDQVVVDDEVYTIGSGFISIYQTHTEALGFKSGTYESNDEE